MFGFCLNLNFNAMFFKLIFKEKLKSLDLIYVYYFLKDKNFHSVFFFVVFKILLYFPLIFSLPRIFWRKENCKMKSKYLHFLMMKIPNSFIFDK